MAEVIWVELLNRQGHVSARFRCAGPELRIGRSYQNDVVLDDPSVAAEHLRVSRGEDGAILVEALGEASAFAIGREISNRSLVTGDTVLRIGHSLLRFRDADYPVPPAMAAGTVDSWRRWLALAALIIAAAALQGLSAWLGETTEPRVSRYITNLGGLGGIVLLWAAIWAVCSRVFGGHTHFARHLAIGLSGGIAYLLYRGLITAATFAFAASSVSTYAFAGLWFLLAIVCFVHLQAVSSVHAAMKAAVLALLALAAIGLDLTTQLDQRAPRVERPLLPPAFRLAHVKSEGQFFAGLDALKAKLDADRALSASSR